eukprot:9476594-Pyramimonas_sp.AAC.1
MQMRWGTFEKIAQPLRSTARTCKRRADPSRGPPSEGSLMIEQRLEKNIGPGEAIDRVAVQRQGQADLGEEEELTQTSKGRALLPTMGRLARTPIEKHRGSTTRSL